MKIKEKEFEKILDELKSLANELGAKVRFEKGDAFDTESVASAQPGTTLGIVSGLRRWR